jgi:hypothetical protein
MAKKKKATSKKKSKGIGRKTVTTNVWCCDWDDSRKGNQMHWLSKQMGKKRKGNTTVPERFFVSADDLNRGQGDLHEDIDCFCGEGECVEVQVVRKWKYRGEWVEVPERGKGK